MGENLSSATECAAQTPNTKTFPGSSFFRQGRASTLPSPAEIRILNKQSGNDFWNSFKRPPPVTIPSLGLFVKYGSEVTISEAKTQVLMHKLLQGKVPIPEVFGWTEDGHQSFIYMSLLDGDTVQGRWGALSESERLGVCEELRQMVKAWRALEQDKSDTYIGSVDKGPLNDCLLGDYPEFSGPYIGANAVQKFHETCDIQIGGDIPIVFTHNDLCPPNIMLSKGPNPRVTAIIDWNQSGWYPAYWEYCKSRRVGSYKFGRHLQEEWWAKYLPMIMDRVDDEIYYHPYMDFLMSHL